MLILFLAIAVLILVLLTTRFSLHPLFSLLLASLVYAFLAGMPLRNIIDSMNDGFGATLGKIGFEGRFDYAAIGTVTNLASRLCEEARSGQILVSQRIYADIEALVQAEPLGELPLKGFLKPMPAFNVLGLR